MTKKVQSLHSDYKYYIRENCHILCSVSSETKDHSYFIATEIKYKRYNYCICLKEKMRTSCDGDEHFDFQRIKVMEQRLKHSNKLLQFISIQIEENLGISITAISKPYYFVHDQAAML